MADGQHVIVQLDEYTHMPTRAILFDSEVDASDFYLTRMDGMMASIVRVHYPLLDD